MNLGIFKMVKMRGLWHARERPAKVYGRTAFVTSLLVSELPYSVACATLFFCLWYFLGEYRTLFSLASALTLAARIAVGLPLEGSKIGYSFVMVQLFFQFQVRSLLLHTLGASDLVPDRKSVV